MENTEQDNNSRNVMHEGSNHNTTPVSLGEWMLTFLLASIPLVGLILLFVWAFSSDVNPSKQNWAKASLLWALIIFVLWVIMMVLMITLGSGSSGLLR